jgi:hypothetical protein
MFYRLLVPEQSLDQMTTLPKCRLNLPRHDRRKPPILSKKCHPCLVPKVSPMCCPRAVRRHIFQGLNFQTFTPYYRPLKISRKDYIIQPGVCMTQEHQRRVSHKANSIL